MILDILQSADVAVLNTLRSFVNPDSDVQVWTIRAFSDIEVIATALVLVGLWLDARFKKGNDIERKKDALAFFYAVMAAFAIYWTLNF